MPDVTPVGDLIDIYYRVREERKLIREQDKALTQKMDILHQAIIEKLDAEKSDLGRGQVATGSVGEHIVGTMRDYPDFERFVYRHKALYLLDKRINSAAYRKELEIRGSVPGVEPFTKRVLSVTKRSK